MFVNPITKPVFKLCSRGDICIDTYHKIMRISHKTTDKLCKSLYKIELSKIDNVPVRIFHGNDDIIVFIHGGGWCVENFIEYARICSLLRKKTGRTVIAVDYRLAPKHPFPTAVNDCFKAVKNIYENNKKSRIVLMGDSAGGNLCAVMSLMGRDKKVFNVEQQVLFYPVVGNDYSETSPFASVKENGSDFLLTSLRMEHYIRCYIHMGFQRTNPYFAPILADDLSNQPNTLIITAEYDLLRDEGIEYAKKLCEFGNKAESCVIKNTTHGFLALPQWMPEVKTSLKYIQDFLEGHKNEQ